MSRFRELLKASATANRFVCTGLDPNPDAKADMLPPRLRACPDYVTAIDQLTRQVVEGVGTRPAAFKPNFGFYFRHGPRGVDLLAALIKRARAAVPDAMIILDIKAGDIDTTAEQYAIAAFETCDADAVTVNPYMGEDAILPFARYSGRGKGVFVLCRTSNQSAARYQDVLVDGEPLYIRVARDMVELNAREGFGNIGLVVGATSREPVVKVREVAPDLPLLIPGFGKKQGGLISDIVPFARPGGRGDFLANLSSEFGKAWQGREDHSVVEGARAKIAEIDAQILEALAA